MNHSNGGNNNVSEHITMVVNSPGGLSGGSDEDDNCPSSPGSTYEKVDLMTAAMGDEVTAQLAAAGQYVLQIVIVVTLCKNI